MKNHYAYPLALAAILSAFCAQAQTTAAPSSVTIYGRIDASIAKNVGSDIWGLQNGAGNRLGFRGVEDLGGGWNAFFTLENRFNIDTGALTDPLRLFRQSFVGLKGPYGRLLLGRDYTPAYWDAMVTADPFGHAGVTAFTNIHTGGISPNRSDDQVNYQMNIGPVSATASVSLDKNTPPLAAYPHRPKSLSLVYDNSTLRVAYGYENPGANFDYWHALTASYALGSGSIRGFYGQGKTSTQAERKSWSIGGTIPVSAVGQVQANYGQLKDGTTGKLSARLGVGYYHSLSKRTTLYADIANDSKVPKNKTGFDMGIRHLF